jgi:TPR repeat protein
MRAVLATPSKRGIENWVALALANRASRRAAGLHEGSTVVRESGCPGIAVAQHNLGLLYVYGQGVSQNDARA